MRAFDPRSFGSASEDYSKQITRVITGAGADVIDRNRYVPIWPCARGVRWRRYRWRALVHRSWCGSRRSTGPIRRRGWWTAALVGIENMRGWDVAQRIDQDMKTKAHVERVRKLPVEHGGQIQKVLGHGHVDNIHAPHLVEGRSGPVTTSWPSTDRRGLG